jgi:PAS domain S-box-containing protein
MQTSESAAKVLSDPADALQRINDVLRLSRSAIWEVDRVGVFTYVSPSFEDLLGYRPEELVGVRNINDFYPPNLPAGIQDEISRDWLGEAREFTNSEVPLLAKSGQIVWVASDGKPIFDGKGNLVGFRGADTDITHRKTIEDRLVRREGELMNLIASAPVAIAYTPINGKGEMNVNAAFVDLFGYPPSDIPTMEDWFRCAYPDADYREYVRRSSEELVAVAQTGRDKALSRDYRITCKDGHVLDVQIDAAIVAGNFIGTFVDVTERRRSIAQALAEKSELRAMLDNLPFPVAVSAAGPDFEWTDARAKVLYVNTRFTALFGYELADLPTVAEWARLAFDDGEERLSILSGLDAQVKLAIAGESNVGPVEARVNAKDGRKLDVIIKAEGVGSNLVTAFEDVTERNRVAGLLRANEETLSSLFEEAPIGIVRMDLASGKLWVNKAFTEMLGYTGEDIPTFEDWLSRAYPDTDHRERVRREWSRASEEALKGDGSIDESEVTVAAKDGLRHEMQFSGVILNNELFGMWVDLTERNRAERLLREQRDQLAHVGRVSALGELAASLAHELDQPLGAILNNAETARILLAKKKPATAELGAILDDIVEDDRRAGEVLDRIRAMVQKQSFRPSAVDVSQLLRDVVNLVQAVAAKKRIRLEASCEPGLSLVEGDRVLLQQALLNLALNSIDAIGSRADGVISLLAGEAGRHRVGISVIDNGGGVPPEEAEQLLQPFHTTKEGGLGMGLPIVNSIVEQHGGSLRVDNQPGCGLSVVLVLPVWEGKAGG